MRIKEKDMDRYYKAYKEFDHMLKRPENEVLITRDKIIAYKALGYA